MGNKAIAPPGGYLTWQYAIRLTQMLIVTIIPMVLPNGNCVPSIPVLAPIKLPPIIVLKWLGWVDSGTKAKTAAAPKAAIKQWSLANGRQSA